MARRKEADAGQPATRRPGFLTDQHGRKWFANIDRKSGCPVGVIQPHEWTAPWYPPQGVLKTNAEDPTKLRIDYEGLLSALMDDIEKWESLYRKTALQQGWDPEDKNKERNVLEIIGPRPKAVEPIVACMKGDKWTLGLTDRVNPKVEPHIRKRVARIPRLLDTLDVTVDEDEMEDLLDIEEEHDPEAVGGKRVKVKSAKRAA